MLGEAQPYCCSEWRCHRLDEIHSPSRREALHLHQRYAEIDIIDGKLEDALTGEALTLEETGRIGGWEGRNFWPTDAESARLRMELAIEANGLRVDPIPPLW